VRDPVREKEEEEQTIKVTDRRAFTPQGERRVPDSPAVEDSPAAGRPPKTVRGEGFTMQDEERPGSSSTPPQVDFSSFILSLASTAFIHLGEAEDPVTRSREVNPSAARQMIDIIQMLHDKTRGNLQPREAEFIEGVLYELKMKFAQRVSG